MDTAAELCITVVIGDVGARLAGGGDSLFRACITQSIGTGMLCGLRTEHTGDTSLVLHKHTPLPSNLGGHFVNPLPLSHKMDAYLPFFV